MLQKLNERIQGIFAWVVIILIAITFSVVGVDYYFQSRQASNTEMVVNDEVITKTEFDNAYRRARQQRDPAALSVVNERALKKAVLDNLVVHKILVQAAVRAGFDVTKEQTDAAITSIAQFQQDGLFSGERFQQALINALFTPETFQKEVRQGILLKQQSFAFIGTSFALPNEIKRFVKLFMQTRDYDYLEIPASTFIDKSQITDAEITAYYKDHKHDFIAPEQIKIQFVRLSMAGIKANIKIDEQDVNKYYDENQSSFLTPAQWQVAHILFAVPERAPEALHQQIKQNANEAYHALQNDPQQFNEWVKTMSADKLSVAANGVLPWISAGQSEYDPALSKLTKAGEISAPFKTTAGYEIFRLIDYKPSHVKPLSQVKEQIIEQLKTEKAQALYAQRLEQLSDLSYQTPDSLQPVADELKLKLEESLPFSRDGGKDIVTRNKQIVHAAFSHDVLELANNSEPVQLDNDTVIVLRLMEHQPAKEKPLTEVKQTIINKLAQEKAETQAKKLADQLLNMKQDPSLHEQLIEQNKLVWTAVNSATRDTDKADAMINDLAFSLPKANTQDGRKLVSGNYVIVRLKKIVDGKFEMLDKEQQASIAQQIEASNGLMEYDLYVNRLVKAAKIDK